MRIIFMGTPEFAVPSLDILVSNGYQVVAVVTAQDSYGGRGGKQLIESSVKKYAISKNIPVLQPAKLKDRGFLQTLASYKADVQIVVAFRMLPEVVWNMPPLGTFNLHGSLLPKYRGAAPINHAIIQGENKTGVTSFKLKHEIDTGDIVLQEALAITDDDTAETLHDKMMVLGAEVILRTVQMLESGSIHFQPQVDGEATAAPKIFHHTCRIDFHQPVKKVYNFIRGLSPYPAAWTIIDGSEMKVLKASYEFSSDQHQPGDIISESKKQLKVRCLDGYISIEQIKPAGKRLMHISDFLNGTKISMMHIG